jgi:acyl-CoA synthetase (AMP-forming)/AMP-acid ligase II
MTPELAHAIGDALTMIPDLLTIDGFIKHWALEKPAALALTFEDKKFDYRELDLRTSKVANMLGAKGLKKGDRIAWIGKNSDLYFALFYGAARLGVVITPIGWRLAPAEWMYILNDTQAKLVFTGAELDGSLDTFRQHIPHVQEILTADQAEKEINSADTSSFAASEPDDAALQLYTSGTTGNPKGAVLTNRNIFGLRAPAQKAGVSQSFYDEDESILLAMPCAHIGGTGLGLLALGAGIPAHILAEFVPDHVFDAFEQKGVTRLFIVPAALQMLLNHPRCSSVDFSGLKYIIYGAAPMPLELLRQCMVMFGAEFIQVYGMTETTGTITMLMPEDHDPEGNQRMRSAGRAVPGVELRIVDANGAELPPGEVGELQTRSSNNMSGYWNLPDATKATLSNDGWIATGDAGYLDEDGYLFIHDRVKDMIITGGENVYPAEVESAIYGHPDILEVAVIGVPDDKWGEAVKAVCVPKPGATIDPDSVFAWSRERIAAFKVPKSIDIIAALPRNASGKILRKDLRAPYWEGRDRQVN